MTQAEKALEARVMVLERMVHEVLRRTGMEDAELLDLEREEAVKIAVQTGNHAAICDWVRKVNGTEERRAS